ncbi:unnamed protein product [Caretta caretta]
MHWRRRQQQGRDRWPPVGGVRLRAVAEEPSGGSSRRCGAEVLCCSSRGSSAAGSDLLGRRFGPARSPRARLAARRDCNRYTRWQVPATAHMSFSS